MRPVGSAPLVGDCARCVGLCCVATAFTASATFAFDKPASVPCRHLGGDYRCTMHGRRRAEGMPGCAVFDCLGAGQAVTRRAGEAADWRSRPQHSQQLFDAFFSLRHLHDLLWHETHALSLSLPPHLRERLQAATAQTQRLAEAPVAELARVELRKHAGHVILLLREASRVARAGSPSEHLQWSGADRIGADLRSADLRGACLRGARLCGANLRHASLERADLTGSDLREADLHGATLTAALFLSQSQLESAHGDGTTSLPPDLRHPRHWIEPEDGASLGRCREGA